jgi:hypothetical protein
VPLSAGAGDAAVVLLAVWSGSKAPTTGPLPVLFAPSAGAGDAAAAALLTAGDAATVPPSPGAGEFAALFAAGAGEAAASPAVWFGSSWPTVGPTVVLFAPSAGAGDAAALLSAGAGDAAALLAI